MKKSPKGFKRWLTAMMILTVPMVSAQTISNLQERPYFPHIGRIARPSEERTTIKKKNPAASRPAKLSYGTASWYSETDPGINLHTANGEIFDDTQLTCASWHFPFGTYLKVINEGNGKSVVCRVNDRGPAKRLNRVIDLTKGAFSRIAPVRRGLIRVSVTPLGKS